GSDHAGFPMKAEMLSFLKEQGHEIEDVGSYDPRPVDFPDIARKVAARIPAGKAERGLMICGTGVGASIGANKMKGIRAAVCHDVHSAHQCVEHDDVNVMCIGAQIVGPWLAKDLIAAYLNAKFSTAEEFRRRVAKLPEMDAGRWKEESKFPLPEEHRGAMRLEGWATARVLPTLRDAHFVRSSG